MADNIVTDEVTETPMSDRARALAEVRKMLEELEGNEEPFGFVSITSGKEDSEAYRLGLSMSGLTVMELAGLSARALYPFFAEQIKTQGLVAGGIATQTFFDTSITNNMITMFARQHPEDWEELLKQADFDEAKAVEEGEPLPR